MIRSLLSIFPRPSGLALFASLVLATSWALATGCVSSQQAGFGVQAAHEGFVPARTAILPCRAWPGAARYVGQPLTSLNDAGLKDLCTDLDTFVVQSFNNQPYMKGFSPKFVMSNLQNASVTSPDDAIPRFWAQPSKACKECKSAPAIYVAEFAARPEWQAWLASLSQAVRNSDAVLVPFVLYADERRYDDRGLAVVERKAGVALLLIDTASGALIWAGGREAAVPAKRLSRGNVPGDLQPPPWDAVMERLQSEDLWRDYPGRQVF